MMSDEKGRLTFVGLGLHDEEGVTLRGLRELTEADIVFAEEYTSRLSAGSVDRLASRIGRMIRLLGRAEVEEGSVVLDACAGRRVAFVTAGDPMAATTHVALRLRAEKSGIKTRVVNGVSALTAVPGLLGLQHYKFGRTTTLPFPQEGYSPTSPYEVVAENLARGLHTLVLLDIDQENDRCMTANEGLTLLLDMERRVGRMVISPGTLVCVVARAGSPDCVTRAGPLSELVEEDFGPPLHTLVVPGKLHFVEEEALACFGRKRSATP